MLAAVVGWVMTKFKVIGELEFVVVVPVVDVLEPEPLPAAVETPPSVIVPVQSGLTV